MVSPGAFPPPAPSDAEGVCVATFQYIVSEI